MSLKWLLIAWAAVTSFASGPASALCLEGRREISVQHSDIRLDAGLRAYLPVGFMTVSLPPPPGGLPPVDCGLYAKSEFPGLSVQTAYATVPPQIVPPGQWAPIGSSAAASPGDQPWFRLRSGTLELFAVRFDGSAPPGTQGRILIAVNEGGDVLTVLRVIGAINVYVGFPEPSPTWFTVTTSARNVSGNRVTLDHRLLNGNGGAKLFVAHVVNPAGLARTLWNHPLITGHDGTRWYIANADGTPMPEGLGFSVRIDASAAQYSTGRPEISGPVPYIEINDPSANGNPYATIAVSHTAWRAVNARPVAVQYRAPRWRIVNVDRSRIPAGVRFNVRVLGFTSYHQFLPDPRLDEFIGNAGGISIAEPVSTPTPKLRGLHFWWQLGTDAAFPMIVTQNLSPMGKNVTANQSYVGLQYIESDAPRWSIVNENGAPIPLSAAFNIFASPRSLVP